MEASVGVFGKPFHRLGIELGVALCYILESTAYKIDRA